MSHPFLFQYLQSLHSMNKKTDWLAEKNLRIDELTENFSISKYNFLKISFLKRLFEESYENSGSCEICKGNLSVLEEMVEEIPHLDLIDHRSPYEKKFNSIRSHFHKKHGFIQPYQFTTKWTLIGIAIGLIPAVIWSLLKMGYIVLDAMLLGSALGLTLGYIWGSYKEARFRRTKKII